MSHPFSLIVHGLRDLAGLELPGIELRSELPRAVPVTMKRDDSIRYLVGLDFATAAAAEDFANSLEEFVDRDGARLFLKRPPAIKQDEVGNVLGIN